MGQLHSTKSAAATPIDFDDLCCKVTLIFEGGFSNDPDDPGGVTNFGITQKLVDRLGLGWDVKKLTKQQALSFYQVYFWRFYHCPLLIDVVIATKLFDMLVNMPGHAVRMLQSALNTLYGSDVVKVDGVLGPVTAKYVNNIQTGQMRRFLLLIKLEQRTQYEQAVAESPVMQKDIKGWLRRAYWPYQDDFRLWPFMPKPGEGWPQGVVNEDQAARLEPDKVSASG